MKKIRRNVRRLNFVLLFADQNCILFEWCQFNETLMNDDDDNDNENKVNKS
jgi:hypothetical protein